MYKVLVVDLDGKVPMHDSLLCDALANGENCRIMLASTTPRANNSQVSLIKLISLVPSKYFSSKSKWKILLRGIEGLLNYLYVIYVAAVNRISIFHFQWLPFMDYVSIDVYMLCLIKLLLPKVKIVLSVHNVFPHDISESRKRKYVGRMKRADKYIDAYILHVDFSKREFVDNYHINKGKVFVTKVGLLPYTEVEPLQHTKDNSIIRLIMYGYHSYYKGTDILLNAMNLLPDIIKDKVFLTVIGKISSDYEDIISSVNSGDNIKIIPYYVDDQILSQEISSADIIVLPYRSISQSGALQLALNYAKPIIASDLEPFKETLFTYDKECFFKNNDASSLSEIISNYILEKINIEEQISRTKELKHVYSWNNTAEQTIKVYNIIRK